MAGKAAFKKFFNFFGSSDSGTEEKSAPALSSGSWPLDLFTSPTVAGPSVTASTALRVPAVLQAVRLIAETVGSLPVKAYRDTDDGKEVAKEHPAYRIVHNRANDWTSAGELRMALTLDALLHGHGFARVVRYDDGRPFELHRLDPSKVSLRVDSITGAPIVLVSEEAGQKLYSCFDVLRVSAFGGVAPIVLGKEAISVAMTLERHAGQFFGNHARPSAVLTKEGKAGAGPDGGATTIKNIRAAWNAVFGPGQSGGPLFLDDGWKYEAATMTSTDAQFVENRVFQIGEIARVFGIPPHLLFELSRATWSNAEQMFDSFLALALRPWLDRWQDAYNTVLFAEDERDDHYTEFVVDDLARADLSARTDAFGKLIAARVMTPNEARAAMNLPAMEGGDELAEILTIAHGSNAVRLSPSLRAGLHLQRTHRLGKIAQALDQTNVSVILDIVDAGTGNDPAGRKIILDTIAAHGVLGLLAFRSTLEAFVITSFGITADDHPAERKEPRRHKPLPFEDWFAELFGMGTGGLGWTPAETWAATPAEISVAYAAKMRATYGDPDTDEQPHDDGELSPEELRANIEKLRSSVRRGKK